MKSVLELFDGESERQQTFLNDKWAPFSCGLLGFGIACFMNYATRRPLMSGMCMCFLIVCDVRGAFDDFHL